MDEKTTPPAPYSFRLDAVELSELKEALNSWLTGKKNKSQGLIEIVSAGLNAKGLYQVDEVIEDMESPEPTMEDVRNDLRYELEKSLRGFVMDLLKDSGRMATMNRISESIVDGDTVSDDVLNNILEGFSEG